MNNNFGSVDYSDWSNQYEELYKKGKTIYEPKVLYEKTWWKGFYFHFTKKLNKCVLPMNKLVELLLKEVSVYKENQNRIHLKDEQDYIEFAKNTEKFPMDILEAFDIKNIIEELFERDKQTINKNTNAWNYN
jgi:hypothetical protein